MPQAAARPARVDDERISRRPRRTVVITGRPDGPPPRRRSEGAFDGPASIPPRRPDTVVTGRPGRLAPVLAQVVEIDRRRPARAVRERLGPRPDRIAMWALMMAVVIVLVAAVSSHAAIA